VSKTRVQAKEKLVQMKNHADKLQEHGAWFSQVYNEYAEFGGIGSAIVAQMDVLKGLIEKMQNRL